VFNLFRKKKKVDNEYLEMMLKVADKHGYIRFVDGYPYIPEIQIRNPENVQTVLASGYIQNIPATDTGFRVYNSMRFCFAFGIIMADVWHREFSKLNQLYFSVDIEEIAVAMDLIDVDKDGYESFVQDCMDGFVELLTQIDGDSDFQEQYNYALIAAQVVGGAIYLKKQGFK
jgi:hypothetical protein